PRPAPLLFLFHRYADPRALHSFPTRRSSDLEPPEDTLETGMASLPQQSGIFGTIMFGDSPVLSPSILLTRLRLPNRLCFGDSTRSEEHTSELQSRENLVCRLLLEKKKQAKIP